MVEVASPALRALVRDQMRVLTEYQVVDEWDLLCHAILRSSHVRLCVRAGRAAAGRRERPRVADRRRHAPPKRRVRSLLPRNVISFRLAAAPVTPLTDVAVDDHRTGSAAGRIRNP
ncbi:hypothetical protein GCM10009736_10190 [Actinomadura bangladeshensis]